MPKTEIARLDAASGVERFVRGSINLLFQPLNEIRYGIRFRTIPWRTCFAIGLALNLFVLTRLDRLLLGVLHLASQYPTRMFAYLVYIFLASSTGFWMWGFWQVLLKRKLITKLTTAFTVAGLKTPLGKFPSFVFDRPIDEMTRKLRLKRQNLSLSQFKSSKESLESSLQVYIDEMKENREKGSVDIIYSHYPMEDVVILGDLISNLPRDTFVIGKSRSRFIKVNLAKTPHFLIGGQTGGGKSTFLRQMITALYLNNKDYNFCLIDLKGGLEFQIFEKLPRMKVMPDVSKAVALIRTLERSLRYRMETLKLNGCKDIESYYKKEPSERKRLDGSYHEKISRTIVVIDEVADLFMASSEVKSKEVQEAKRVIWKIGAQGRAVGLHLVVATQRPDVKALDSQVKTHLVGVVCFPMVNDASSMTVLGNGRATDLPRIPGRAIWKSDLDMMEIQTPLIKPEEVLALVKTAASEVNIDKDNCETPINEPGNPDPVVSLEMESRNHIDTSNEVLLEGETRERAPQTPTTAKEWVHPNFD